MPETIYRVNWVIVETHYPCVKYFNNIDKAELFYNSLTHPKSFKVCKYYSDRDYLDED